MARYTSLYQSPRSPLIQGRTRWERPLWQAWAGGAAVGGVVMLAVVLTFFRTSVPAAIAGLLAGGLIVGSGLGALLARMWGWRRRWLGGAFVGAAAIAVVFFSWYLQTGHRVG